MAGKGGVFLVTGATSGIGKAVAIACLRAGYKVVLVGRRATLLDEVVTQSGALAQDALCVPCDVTDPDSVDALFDRIKERFGRLDVVFNNAGISNKGAPVGDISFETWREVLSVNLDGAFLIARGAFRLMRDQSPQGGRIINNGSISAYVPRPGSAPYTASKHAITGLTRTISLDGRPYGIACGQLDIGNAASDMTEQMAKGVPQADGSVKAEPVMDVSNVVNAVLHMASLPPEANVQFMTVMATNMPFIGRG